jgi:hypothetical protein
MINDYSYFYISSIYSVASITWGPMVQQAIVANYSTIGHTVRRRTPTGNGTNTAWTGDYTAIDEYPISSNDMITTNTSNQSETYTAAALSLTPTGKVVKAVSVAASAMADDTSTTKTLRGVLRINGTDYVSPPMQGTLDSGYSGRMAIWDTNPATGSAWTDSSQISSAEFGVKSDV